MLFRMMPVCKNWHHHFIQAILIWIDFYAIPFHWMTDLERRIYFCHQTTKLMYYIMDLEM